MLGRRTGGDEAKGHRLAVQERRVRGIAIRSQARDRLDRVPEGVAQVEQGPPAHVVGCFLAFIHHITSSIQVSQVISRIGERTLGLADDMYPHEVTEAGIHTGPTWSPEPDTPRVALSTRTRHGSLTYVDYPALVRSLVNTTPW